MRKAGDRSDTALDGALKVMPGWVGGGAQPDRMVPDRLFASRPSG